jgi:D-alanyl-D-alanine carboxypeptidase (penicillin-binding protein 5/6)
MRILALLLAFGPTPVPSALPLVACPTVPVTRPAVPMPSPLPIKDAAQPTVGGAALSTTGLAVPPGAPAVPADVSARDWVVADLDTGAVLGACAPHAYSAPASVQKLLLVATVMPRLDPHATTVVTAGDLNIEPDSSAVGLVQGGQYTVDSLWLGLLLESGNDAANVLARLGGGAHGVAGTVADMNVQARHLGALDTHAATPSGLDGPGQVTSAYDLALIARNDFGQADFRRYTATTSANMPGQPGKPAYQIQNDNQLLYNYPGAIGGKTGFTDIAQHTYVGAAGRNGRRLVVTMLNGEHQPVPMWRQGAALLDWGFSLPAGASVGQLVPPGALDPHPTPSASAIAPVVAAGSSGAATVSRAWLIGGGLVVAALVLIVAGLAWLARRRTR